jgi:N-acetylglutamate synthase-like GNAT family acetyltransferase
VRVSTNKTELDVPLIHHFLAKESYWARGIPLQTVQRSIANSLCFGGFLGEEQIAFARVISDYATFANLVDVFVLPHKRGQGHSKILLTAVMDHPSLQGIRRFTLATTDAHALYAQFGFGALAKPASFMERYDPEVYSGGHDTWLSLRVDS